MSRGHTTLIVKLQWLFVSAA